MISVIIPYMAVWPYCRKIERTLDSLKAQTIYPEIIVSEQPISQYINLNALINQGIRQSKYDKIFMCNADIELVDSTLLERMLNTDYDVIFCAYYSHVVKGYKPSDGAGVYTNKGVISDFGEFDESLLGVSRATFVFVDWVLKNTNWHCSDEFQIDLIRNEKLSQEAKAHFGSLPVKPIKVHRETRKKCKPYVDRCISVFKYLDLWGFN